MTLTPETEQLLQWFIILSGILIIPVVVAALVVMFKLAFLIHSTSEFLTVARYELFPLIKEIRLTVDHVEDISQRASAGMKELSQGISQLRPLVSDGADRFKVGFEALVSGIKRSFRQS